MKCLIHNAWSILNSFYSLFCLPLWTLHAKVFEYFKLKWKIPIPLWSLLITGRCLCTLRLISLYLSQIHSVLLKITINVQNGKREYYPLFTCKIACVVAGLSLETKIENSIVNIRDLDCLKGVPFQASGMGILLVEFYKILFVN